MHSKSHLIRLAAGLRSDPLGGELSALARPQLLGRENGFYRWWDKKGRMRKNKGKEKSIVVPQNLISLSLLL